MLREWTREDELLHVFNERDGEQRRTPAGNRFTKALTQNVKLRNHFLS